MQKVYIVLATIIFSLANLSVGAQGLNPGVSTGGLSDQQVVAIQQLIGRWVAENPDAIRKALNGASNNMSDKDDWVFGNKNGDVAIITYLDRDAPNGGDTVLSLAALASQDSNLKVILKELPLLSPASVTASLTAAAMRRHGDRAAGSFEAALASQSRPLTQESIKAALATGAASANLNANDIAVEANEPSLREYLKKNREEAKELGVPGTPTFIIGNHALLGTQTQTALSAAVAQARKENGM